LEIGSPGTWRAFLDWRCPVWWREIAMSDLDRCSPQAKRKGASSCEFPELPNLVKMRSRRGCGPEMSQNKASERLAQTAIESRSHKDLRERLPMCQNSKPQSRSAVIQTKELPFVILRVVGVDVRIARPRSRTNRTSRSKTSSRLQDCLRTFLWTHRPNHSRLGQVQQSRKVVGLNLSPHFITDFITYLRNIFRCERIHGLSYRLF
jgi:hypothetical protein